MSAPRVSEIPPQRAASILSTHNVTNRWWQFGMPWSIDPLVVSRRFLKHMDICYAQVGTKMDGYTNFDLRRRKWGHHTIWAKDGILLWEDLLGGRTSEMIRATCCKGKDHPTLAWKEIDNSKAPILIPWKCTHTTTCDNCGIEKKLHIADSPILSGCTELIPVKEWWLAPRAGKNKKGEQNTQIELTDAKNPPLERCCCHR